MLSEWHDWHDFYLLIKAGAIVRHLSDFNDLTHFCVRSYVAYVA